MNDLSMGITPKPPENDTPNVNELLGLLDFYSSRAVAHASFFIASIFGLVAFSSMTSTAFSISLKFYFPAFLLFFGLAYLGYHALTRFRFYAAIAQHITYFGLKNDDVLKSIITSRTDKAKNLLDDFSKGSNEQDKLLIFTRMRKYFSNWDTNREKAKKENGNHKKIGLGTTSYLIWIGYWFAMVLLTILVFSECPFYPVVVLLLFSIVFTIIPAYIKLGALDDFKKRLARALERTSILL